MADFTERIRLKGKAEEDIYFAELNRKLIVALHEKQISKQPSETSDLHDKDCTSSAALNSSGAIR